MQRPSGVSSRSTSSKEKETYMLSVFVKQFTENWEIRNRNSGFRMIRTEMVSESSLSVLMSLLGQIKSELTR